MKRSVLCSSLGVAALALTGCHHDNPASNQPAVSPPSPAASLPAPRDKAIVYVVNPKATGDQDPLMPRMVALHRSSSPARDAVNALLQSDGSPIPSGTHLRGIKVSNGGLATLDFSQSPINETGGEGGQANALTALSRTLGQFPEIRQYQIEVKGQPMKSFGEEGALDGPMDVVRPDAVQQAKGTAP